MMELSPRNYVAFVLAAIIAIKEPRGYLRAGPTGLQVDRGGGGVRGDAQRDGERQLLPGVDGPEPARTLLWLD